MSADRGAREAISRRPLVVVAHALAPGPGGAEALVNAALVTALVEAGDDVLAIAASTGDGTPTSAAAPTVDTTGIVRVSSERGDGGRGTATSWLDAPRHTLRGAAARVVDRSRAALGMAPLRTAAWGGLAAERLLATLDADDHWRTAVVWARATPPESFEATIRAHRRRPFPLVANYNDPMPPDRVGGPAPWSSTDRASARVQVRQNRYLAAHADAWTFPSAALRDLMVERAGLDPERCFVIPHVVPARVAAPRPVAAGPLRLLYAGTLYRWVFDKPLAGVLAEWSARGRLTLVVAAVRASDDQMGEIEAAIPGVEVHRDLPASQLDALVDGVDALLVVDNRPPLLLTKVVDAVRRIRPVLALAPPDSTTARVIADAGGFTADRTDRAAIDLALHRVATALSDPVDLADRRRSQEVAAEQFAPTRVLAEAHRVMDCAADVFDARRSGLTNAPAIGRPGVPGERRPPRPSTSSAPGRPPRSPRHGGAPGG